METNLVVNGADDTIDTRDEQIELYILGLLDEREMEAVERLLRDNPAARERARELREVVSMLAFDVEPLDPPAGLKARIMEAARADLAPAPMPAPPISLAERRRGSLTRWTPWLVAAALALALAGSLIWNAQLRSDLDAQPETATYAVAGSGAAEGVAGTLIVVGDEDDAILNLAGLAALPSDRAYQVWLIADDAPVPNVTFVPNAAGTATVSVPGQIDDYSTLAITIEPLAGSLAPTTDPIIVSDLTQTL